MCEVKSRICRTPVRFQAPSGSVTLNLFLILNPAMVRVRGGVPCVTKHKEELNNYNTVALEVSKSSAWRAHNPI